MERLQKIAIPFFLTKLPVYSLAKVVLQNR